MSEDKEEDQEEGGKLKEDTQGKAREKDEDAMIGECKPNLFYEMMKAPSTYAATYFYPHIYISNKRKCTVLRVLR